MAGFVLDTVAQVMPADPVRAAAELYVAAVRALGTPSGHGRGDDETIIRVRDGAGCGEDHCGDGCESAGYVLVTLAVAGASRVTIKALRALTPGRGDGSRMLLTLCNLAEVYRVRLELVAAPLDVQADALAVARRLAAWYKRFGFRGGMLGLFRTPMGMKR